jgi:hypothetical protein
MAKLSTNMHLTLRIGRMESNQYVKFGVEVSEIDTEQPLDEQLKKVRETIPQAINAVMEELEKQVDVVTGYELVRKGQSS